MLAWWVGGGGLSAAAGAHRHLVLVSYRQMHRPMRPTFAHFVDARFAQGRLWTGAIIWGYWGRGCARVRARVCDMVVVVDECSERSKQQIGEGLSGSGNKKDRFATLA
jgi:hypothetical protein